MELYYLPIIVSFIIERTLTDESIGAVTSWDWTFEGGDPPTSTDQHPVVNYVETGQWDVSLTVSDGTNSHTFDSPGLIQVNELPDVTLMPLDTVCLNYEPFELTGGLPEGGSYSGNGVADGYFYPDMAGVGTHEIIYSYVDENECENWAAEMIEVEICTGIDDPEKNEIFIVPNPASNLVTIFVGGNNHRVNFSIIDVEGRQVMNAAFTGNKNNLDISAFKRGLYMIRFEIEGKLFIRKLVVI